MSETPPPGPGRSGARGSRKSFTQVEIAQHPDGAGFALLLDGTPLRTPQGHVFRASDRELAEHCAGEWRAQREFITRETLLLTNLLCAATDDPSGLGRWAQAEWMRFGASDLLWYWPDGDERLAARCEAAWQPLLHWAEARLDNRIILARGLQFTAQDDALLAALAGTLAARPVLAQAAMAKLAGLTGSTVLALAVAEKRISAAEAFHLARLDEHYQAETWGEDAEAAARASAMKREMLSFAALLDSPVPD